MHRVYSNAVHTSNLHLFAPIFLHYVTRHHFKLVLNICVAEANIAFLLSIDAYSKISLCILWEIHEDVCQYYLLFDSMEV